MTTITLAELERRVAALEAVQPAPMPEACRDRTCSYVEFYLAQGPVVLSHEGYHAAEARCLAAHDAIDRHFVVDHPECRGRGCADYERLERTAQRWDLAVRA